MAQVHGLAGETPVLVNAFCQRHHTLSQSAPASIHCPKMAHAVERRISDLRIVLLIVRPVGYLDTVEVSSSSLGGPTI